MSHIFLNQYEAAIEDLNAVIDIKQTRSNCSMYEYYYLRANIYEIMGANNHQRVANLNKAISDFNEFFNLSDNFKDIPYVKHLLFNAYNGFARASLKLFDSKSADDALLKSQDYICDQTHKQIFDLNRIAFEQYQKPMSMFSAYSSI